MITCKFLPKKAVEQKHYATWLTSLGQIGNHLLLTNMSFLAFVFSAILIADVLAVRELTYDRPPYTKHGL